MDLYYIKLKSGQDIISGFKEYEEHEAIQLIDPLEVSLSPSDGLFCKDFLYLSSSDTVFIDLEDVLFISPAGERSISTYNQWSEQRPKSTKDTMTKEIEESEEELEELFTAMLESNSSIKH